MASSIENFQIVPGSVPRTGAADECPAPQQACPKSERSEASWILWNWPRTWQLMSGDGLGLGDQPIINLRSILESEVGLRIFYGDLPSAMAGMYDYRAGSWLLPVHQHQTPGGAAAGVDGPRVRAWHRGPAQAGHRLPLHAGRKPANERFADAFAAAFLMPATSVRRRFLDVVNTTGDFQVADLCRLAHAYFVSVDAMAYRLEKLGLVPKGRAELLKESKLPVRRGQGTPAAVPPSGQRRPVSRALQGPGRVRLSSRRKSAKDNSPGSSV